VGGAAETGYVVGQKERTAGETISDQWIFTKVKAAINSEGKIKSRNVSVKVRKGVVTLEGLVNTPDEKNLAVVAARGVKGVKHVQNRLKLP
jgi:hyperosmotically inducible protein